MIHAIFRKFVQDRRANVAMMFGLMVVPMIFIVGMGIDYGTAARLKSKMNAAADAAVLAAVTPAMMTQSDANSSTAATNMFNALVAGLPRLIYNPASGLTVTVADVGLQRNVTVAYSAQSQNLFGGVPRFEHPRVRRLLDGRRRDAAEHQFLSASRQFALDGDRRHADRHHDDGEQHLSAERLRIRLS